MSKLKTRVGTWVVVLPKELEAGWHLCCGTARPRCRDAPCQPLAKAETRSC